MQSYYTKPKIYFYTLLLVSIYASSYDMYIASFPSLQDFFHTSTGAIQLSLTIFVVAAIFTAVPVGIISDLYGRKKCIIGLIMIAIIGTLLCVFATGIYQFYIGRALQGIAGSGIYIVSISIPNDLLKGEEFLKVWQWLTLAFYIAPSIATALGGYIVYHFNWETVFHVILVICIFALLCIVFTFKETGTIIKRNEETSRRKAILTNYKKVFSNQNFLIYCYVTAVAWAGIAVFYTILPFVIIDHLNYTPVFFGWVTFSMVICGVLGRLVNMTFFIRLMNLEQSVFVFSIMNTLSAALVFLALIFPENVTIYILIISCMLFGFSSSISAISGSSAAFKIFDKSLSASATAIYGLIIDLVIFMGLIVSPMLPASILTLGCILISLTGIGLCLVVKARRNSISL